ncbi:MAG: tautomerase family protein [Eubacteriales bacterium]|nr:tautomerase family protein [Eubacteriales bacterium]MDD4390091.1 tautomerase family protein [Eubacteriales bacterium]
MPIVNVSWNTKADSNQKKELMNFITDAIHETTNTKKELVYVFFRDYDDTDVSNPDCPVVQINWTAQPARNPESKAELIKRIQGKVSEYPNVNGERVVVIITDVPLDSAGVGGVTRAVGLA